MAKKKVKVEEPWVSNIDYPVDIRINIPTKTGITYSPCAFGDSFVNYKNYITLGNLEQTKKDMIPAIGSIVKDREGFSYKITDLHTEAREGKKNVNTGESDPDITMYIFNLEELS